MFTAGLPGPHEPTLPERIASVRTAMEESGSASDERARAAATAQSASSCQLSYAAHAAAILPAVRAVLIRPAVQHRPHPRHQPCVRTAPAPTR